MLTVLKTIPQAAIQFAAYDGVKDILVSLFPRDNSSHLSQARHTYHLDFTEAGKGARVLFLVHIGLMGTERKMQGTSCAAILSLIGLQG